MRLIDADAAINELNENQIEGDEFYKGLGKAKSVIMELEYLKTLFVIKEEDVYNGECHCEIIGNRGWTNKEDAVVEFKKLVADKKSLTWLWSDERNVVDNDNDTLFEFHEDGNYNECHYSLSVVELKI